MSSKHQRTVNARRAGRTPRIGTYSFRIAQSCRVLLQTPASPRPCGGRHFTSLSGSRTPRPRTPPVAASPHMNGSTGRSLVWRCCLNGGQRASGFATTMEKQVRSASDNRALGWLRFRQHPRTPHLLAEKNIVTVERNIKLAAEEVAVSPLCMHPQPPPTRTRAARISGHFSPG